MRKIFVLLILTFVLGYEVSAQTDSLVLKNKNYIVGEIKSMDRGVLTIETDYSDSDFKVTWLEIAEIYSNVNFLISTTEGVRYNGKLNTTEEGQVRIDYYNPDKIIKMKKADEEDEPTDFVAFVPIADIVYLNSLDEGFWSRLSANIDFGWSLTRANNLRQVSLRSGLGYLANRWKASASVNSLSSSQNEVEDIRRTDGGVAFNFFLPKDWFLAYNFTFLSNTEQLLDLRTGNKLSVGKYFTRTNRTYFAFQVGANFNNEVFLDDTPTRQSGEAFIGSELNLYDIGDFNLLTNVAVYPSLSEKGRLRTDFALDVKYDFLDDFYVKFGTTLNYDNQPVEGAPTLDYIFQTTVGWEL
ncbi:DUF481 domain-containing protein [Algoriphagus sediminis]|uniref:DUF481 domain-containing protein n=1 Tax=Algoriphagus sediminis TaxID=3057113 RepID=A0ABT7YF49_9BACT|nr:DUF481 domain-containing protein [Algoriphagus sediminis]MDN3204824.1 DUF481 domain-containing protein [Algoriphagus sediminis]